MLAQGRRLAGLLCLPSRVLASRVFAILGPRCVEMARWWYNFPSFQKVWTPKARASMLGGQVSRWRHVRAEAKDDETKHAHFSGPLVYNPRHGCVPSTQVDLDT